MRRLHSLLRLSLRQCLLLLEAALTLGVARAATLAVPFRYLAPRLGRQGEETPPTLVHAAQRRAAGVFWAIAVASRQVPWRCPCLAQAVAGQAMLQRRRIAATLYLGVALGNGTEATSAATPMTAHAWLRSGTLTLLAPPTGHRYHIIATFAGEEA
jgi:hypothetical protein